jgi:hypothetical protein
LIRHQACRSRLPLAPLWTLVTPWRRGRLASRRDHDGHAMSTSAAAPARPVRGGRMSSLPPAPPWGEARNGGAGTTGYRRLERTLAGDPSLRAELKRPGRDLHALEGARPFSSAEVAAMRHRAGEESETFFPRCGSGFRDRRIPAAIRFIPRSPCTARKMPTRGGRARRTCRTRRWPTGEPWIPSSASDARRRERRRGRRCEGP